MVQPILLTVSLLSSVLRLQFSLFGSNDTKTFDTSTNYPVSTFQFAGNKSLDTVSFDNLYHILTLSTAYRNLSIAHYNNECYLNTGQRISSKLRMNVWNQLEVRCMNFVLLKLKINDANSYVYSPSLCATNYKSHLSIGTNTDHKTFIGCIENVYMNDDLLMDNWCSENLTSASENRYHKISLNNVDPIYIGREMELTEGTSVPLHWKNIYPFPQHSQFNISNNDFIFRIVEYPKHGVILLKGVAAKQFSYNDILSSNVIYKHDDSETFNDIISFQVRVKTKLVQFNDSEKIYELPISIIPLNDPPTLQATFNGSALRIADGGRMVLDEKVLMLSDVDNSPDDVYVSVLLAKGVRLENSEQQVVVEFSQRELLNRKIHLVHLGKLKSNELILSARDNEKQSLPLNLTVLSVPIQFNLEQNTGLELFYLTSELITSSNLSFSTNWPNYAPRYIVVEKPKLGKVECKNGEGKFQACEIFYQTDIQQNKVRYIHYRDASRSSDKFRFKVVVGSKSSGIYSFNIAFIPLQVKVFMQEPFVMTDVDRLAISHSNLFTWVFPKNFPMKLIIYMVTSTPRYGTLFKRNNPRKRITVKGNFTQQEINDGEVAYLSRFKPTSVVNDSLEFRIVYPLIFDESVRFNILLVTKQSREYTHRSFTVTEGSSFVFRPEHLHYPQCDYDHFLYNVISGPSFGAISLETALGTILFDKFTNFTGNDLEQQKVQYHHFGGENTVDKMFVIAERQTFSGIRNEASENQIERIPFWIEFKILLQNDNQPQLQESLELQVIEGGTRHLYPYLLPWNDQDMNAAPLTYNILDDSGNLGFFLIDNYRSSVRNFSHSQMAKGEIGIKHYAGSQKSFYVSYAVSDQTHTVTSKIRVFASEPFLQLKKSKIYVHFGVNVAVIPVSKEELCAETNLDANSTEIYFRTFSDNWLDSSTINEINHFTQDDINNKKVLYRFRRERGTVENILVETMNKQFEGSIKVASVYMPKSHISMQNLRVCKVTRSPVTRIGNYCLKATSVEGNVDNIIYTIIEKPKNGFLLKEDDTGANKSNKENEGSLVTKFSQRDVDNGALLYFHQNLTSNNDSLQLSVSYNGDSVVHFVLPIDIVQEKIRLLASNISVFPCGKVPLSSDVISVVSNEDNNYNFQITRQPNAGSIVFSNNSHSSTAFQFTSVQLHKKQIFYVNNPSSDANADSFTIIVCVDKHYCSEETIVNVTINKVNFHGPQLKRNEPMVLVFRNLKPVPLTKQYLYSEDSGTLPENIWYLASNFKGFRLAHVDQPSKNIAKFSQFEVDNSRILLILTNSNETSVRGGFSFLVSNELHQVGPFWYEVFISISRDSLMVPEANNHLIIPPANKSFVISADILRALMTDVVPSDVLYVIHRKPNLGTVLLNSFATDEFTQDDVNLGKVSYRLNWSSDITCEQLDFFTFELQNGNSKRRINEKYKFKILITYAAIENVDRMLHITPINITSGSSVALNSTHLDFTYLENLCKNELLINVSQKTRRGQIQPVDPEKSALTFTTHEVTSGRSVIYVDSDPRNGFMYDSILFEAFLTSQKKEVYRRSLTFAIPIRFQQSDPHLQIIAFAEQVHVVSDNDVLLKPELFKATSLDQPLTSVSYAVQQDGSNGAKITVDGLYVSKFSQEDLNRGRVRLRHKQLRDTDERFDVVVFEVSKRIKAVKVFIESVPLLLVNHSDIMYPQDAKYIILTNDNFDVNWSSYRSKTIYTITKPPKYGIFLTVHGEQEVSSFSQRDIDEKNIYFIPTNYSAYQDYFEFTVGSATDTRIQNSSRIICVPIFKPQVLLVSSEMPTLIQLMHLNASSLTKNSPIFTVIDPPTKGILVKNNNLSVAIEHFSLSEVEEDRIAYMPTESQSGIIDNAELQIDAENVQSARFRFFINLKSPAVGEFEATTTIDSSTYNNFTTSTNDDESITAVAKYFPLLIIVFIFLFILIFIIACRRRTAQRSKRKVIVEQKQLQSKLNFTVEEQPDLLDTTVYATIGRNRNEQQLNKVRYMRSFDTSPQIFGNQTYPTRIPEPQTTVSKPEPNYDVSVVGRKNALNAINKSLPPLPPSVSSASGPARLKQNQYWV